MKICSTPIIYFLCLVFFTSEIHAQATWQQFASQPGTGSRQDDIFFVDENTGWTIEAQNTGSNRRGYIYKTTDGGNSWVTQDVRTGTHYRALGFTSTTRGFAGNLGAGSWSNATDTNPLYETYDGGNTWTVVPGLPSDVLGICAIQILDSQTIIAAGRVRGPGAGLSAATNGGVNMIKSTDNGATWTYIDLSSANPNIASGEGMGGIMDVHFFDQNNGYVIGMDEEIYTTTVTSATYHGKIMKTTDGGSTWSEVITVPHLGTYFWKIVFPSPNIGYASLQNNNSGYPNIRFYKTIDGGDNWTEQIIPVNGAFVQGIGFVDETTGWISGSGNASIDMFEINYSSPTATTFTYSNISQAGRERLNKYRFITDSNGSTIGYTAGSRIHVFKEPEPELGNTPCEAISVAVGASVAGSITTELTQSGGVPAPNFFSNTGSANSSIWNTGNVCEDRWYRVEAPASGGVRAEFIWTGTGSADLAVAAYTGDCSTNSPTGFTLLGADDGANLPELSVSCQNPGDSIYFRVWDFGCNDVSSFSITFTDVGNEVIGDEAYTAVNLPVNLPTLPPSSFQYGEVTGDYFETKTNNIFPSCGTYNYQNGCEDIWYKIAIPATAPIMIEANRTDAALWMGLALYNTDCPTATSQELMCVGQDITPTMTYNGTAGENVYLRVWDYDCNNTMTFDIRAYIDSNISNPTCTTNTSGNGDEPCDAPCLPIDGSSRTGVINTSFSQTGSGIPDPTLFSNTGSLESLIWNTSNTCEDIWYQVPIGPSGGFRANFTSLSGSSDLVVAAYSGTCSGLTPVDFEQLGADDGASVPVISVSCQNEGDIVYLRISEFNCNTDATFQVSLQDIFSDVPAGDEPISAIALTVDDPLFPASLTLNYTETKGIPFPTGCTNGAADFDYTNGCEDIWFEVTVPTTDYFIFEVDFANSGSIDPNMAIYNDNCPGEVAQLTCDDNGGNNSNPEIQYFANAGDRIYIRVWDSNCDLPSAMFFDIRVYTLVIPYDLPVCSTMELVFDIATPLSLIEATQTNSALSFPSIPDPAGCSNYVSNSWDNAAPADREDIWVKVEVPASGVFEVSATSTGGAGDVELAVYETADGNCGTPTGLVACDGDALAGDNTSIVVGCRTPGEIMYVRVWEKETDTDVLPSIFVTEIINSGDEVSNSEPIAVGQTLPVDLSMLTHSWGAIPSCGNHQGASGCEDKWFSTTVDGTGGFIAGIINETTDKGIAVYAGTCYDNLVEIGCSDGTGASLLISGRTQGEILYIRTWDEQCDLSDTYSIELSSRGVLLSPIAWLQGPYLLGATTMTTDLETNSYLPLIQPYTVLGWHSGNESTTTAVLANYPVVDWVLLELRNALDNTQVLETKAGLLMENGVITDVDGVSSVPFSQPDGSYYVVVRHRNHLGIMTQSPVNLLTATPTTIDFGTVALHGNSPSGLVNGNQVLWMGDATSSGTVDAADRSEVWNDRNQTGYISSDTNLDGTSNASDRSDVWNNRNKTQQLP